MPVFRVFDVTIRQTQVVTYGVEAADREDAARIARLLDADELDQLPHEVQFSEWLIESIEEADA